MKKVFILLAILNYSLATLGQENNNSGKVIYLNTKKIEIKINGEYAQLADQFPKESKSEKELIFTPDASIYRNVPKPHEDDLIQESGGATFVFKMQSPDEFVYSDIKNKVNTAQREFLTRQFLIESKTDTVQWKLTGNQKNILEYTCIEAELIGSSKKTTAWFTPAIPISTGPDGFTGLPGLILSIDIDEGKTTILAQSIEFRNIDSDELTKPNNGKKVTDKEFKKIIDEKTKEMKERSSGGTLYIKAN